jgi:hypothetical protein
MKGSLFPSNGKVSKMFAQARLLMAKLFCGAREFKMSLYELLPFFSCAFSYGTFPSGETLLFKTSRF